MFPTTRMSPRSHLFVQSGKEQGRTLGQFLQHKCSMSITLALKIIFNLNANAFYGTPDQSALCEELLQECEMSLVNAKVALGAKDQERRVWLEEKQKQHTRRKSLMNDLLDEAAAGREGAAVVVDLDAVEEVPTRARSLTARELRDMEANEQLKFQLDEQELSLIKSKHIRSEYFNQGPHNSSTQSLLCTHCLPRV